MPGAAEFPAPSSALRSPRASVPRFERGPDVAQASVMAGMTSQPMTVECYSVGEAVETGGGAGYCTMQLAPQPQYMAPVPASGPIGGAACGGGLVYCLPLLTVPYASSMGQVNLGWAPSQDPYGKDLPLSDMNTLRFFFNLGVEYYRLSASTQHQQPAQQLPGYLTAPHMPQLLPGAPPAYMALDQGYPAAMAATPPQAQGHTHGQVVYMMNPQLYGPAPPCPTYQPYLHGAGGP